MNNFYFKYGKRVLDIIVSLVALIILFPIISIVSILVYFKIGSPIIFKQKRPGKNEVIFDMFKFRSMTNEKDSTGKLLSDEKRLLPFGKFLRDSSLDELPELWNILMGNMSLVGPRPQLVRDMIFMTEEQRRRHNVTPGLTGLAQVNGRNNITWEEKLEFDLQYIENITFLGDIGILIKTVTKVLAKEDVNTDGMHTAEDLGDYLLRTGKISKDEYENILKRGIK